MNRLSVSDSFPRFILQALVAGVAALTPGLHAETVFESISKEVEELFTQSKAAVVRIEGNDKHGPLSGTGFFIDSNGTLFTSYSVGGNCQTIVVSYGDKKYPAQRLVSDPRSGIALLKVEASTPFLPIGHTRDLGVSSPVVAIGYPLDLPVSPNFGMVTGFDLRYLGRYFSTTHIRANIPVQRGQGGAPLLNMKGEVVGILISGLDNKGSGCYALPIEAAEKIRRDFYRFGEVRPGWIGIAVRKARENIENSNAEIQQLLEQSPAAEGGLQKGDILLQIGEKKIDAPEDVLDASFYLSVGDKVPMTVIRNGEKLTFTINAARNPSAPKEVVAAPGIPDAGMHLQTPKAGE